MVQSWLKSTSSIQTRLKKNRAGVFQSFFHLLFLPYFPPRNFHLGPVIVTTIMPLRRIRVAMQRSLVSTAAAIRIILSVLITRTRRFEANRTMMHRDRGCWWRRLGCWWRWHRPAIPPLSKEG
ncbi:MAG: hypothetical protein J3R72DRAFT_36558 [Linnemannia gamsii]|nr:MAG: hypothetical protein J3R72DRAFT_36558 [Linnemannia gamsii]